MDLVTGGVIVATGFATAVTTLAGAYFWIRRGNQKFSEDVKAGEYRAEKQHEDDAIKRWQDFAEYQQKTFRQKNEEQDARFAAMQREHDTRLEALVKKLDDMHHAHLKCERDSMEREIGLKREASDRAAELKQQQQRIETLQTELDHLKGDMILLTTRVETKKD